MKGNIKIACLPVAGIENPYQYLMIKGLNSETKINAVSGINDRFFGILRTAFKLKPDYIHFDWITSYYLRRRLWMTIMNIPLFIIQILIVRYFLRIKLVWTLHNIQPHDAKYLFLHNLCRRFFARQTSFIRLFSKDSVLTANNLLKVKANLLVCQEGSYVDYYKNSTTVKEARDILNINENDFVYLYLGLIKPYKGIEDLIKHFKKLDVKNKKLIIAGKVLNQNYFMNINEKNNNILIINRFIENDELQYFYKSANVVVLPFKKVENSGSAILAMGFKKPIITPNIGSLAIRLKKQKQYLYDNQNLFKKLELAYKNKDNLDEIGLQNYNELKNYSWNDFSKYFD